MKRIVAWVFAVVLSGAAVVAGAFLLLRSFHYPVNHQPQFAAACSPVAGIAGPSDLQIDPATRFAFVSSHERGADGTARGAVYVFSLDDPLAADAWRDRTKGRPAHFEPAGLYFFEGEGARRLFVVNAAARAVEIYNVAENGDLEHLETLSERRLTSPNDIVATGPRSFYVTNDVDPGRNSLLGRLHFLFRAGSGRVMHYDGSVWREAAAGLRFASGVALSPAGDRLYVSETAAAALRIYERDPANGALRWSRTAPMPAAVDNINVEHSGALWIGAHPRPLPLMGLAPLEGPPPSLVLRYDDIAGMTPPPDIVYANNGEEIAASSVAAKLGSTLLIGSQLEKKFLICHLAG